ncbi:hypothetical protein B0H14DRAFT_2561960 [Mycena olivaceomarginata]|nr:hypothetical protein B0H14DRAFT_2561960 [Mycena olivaceomarginata]
MYIGDVEPAGHEFPTGKPVQIRGLLALVVCLTLSDSDFAEKPTKGKGKAQSKPLSTRQSTRKATVKEDDSVIEVEPNSSKNAKGKTLKRATSVKVKIEPGLAVTQGPTPSSSKNWEDKTSKRSTPGKVKVEPGTTTDSLFFEIDSDSDVDFPDSLIGPQRVPACN